MERLQRPFSAELSLALSSGRLSPSSKRERHIYIRGDAKMPLGRSGFLPRSSVIERRSPSMPTPSKSVGCNHMYVRDSTETKLCITVGLQEVRSGYCKKVNHIRCENFGIPGVETLYRFPLLLDSFDVFRHLTPKVIPQDSEVYDLSVLQ